MSTSLPALDVQTPSTPNIMDQYQNMLKIQSMRQSVDQQQQLAPLQQQQAENDVQSSTIDLQQKQQAQKDQEAFRTTAADPSMADKTVGQIADALAKQGKISQEGWAAAKKSDIDSQAGVAKLTTEQLASMKAGHEATQQLYNNVMDMPDDQLAANWPQIAQQYDAIPGNNKTPLNPQQPMTKQQLKQFAPLLSMNGAYLDQELDRRNKQADVQDKEGKVDPKSPLYSPSPQAVAMGTAPGSAQIVAGETREAGAKAGAEAAARQPYEMSLARQRQALTQGDPDAAGRLLVDGDATLSELKSRGATPQFIEAALNSAHKLSGGKYNAQSADAAFSVAKSPTQVAFFGSSKSLTDPGGTLDQLAAAGKDLPGGKFPAFNSIADWEKAAAGTGPIAKYASVALGIADDYAKVVGGGVGSDTSRMQALNLIPKNASPEARDAAISGIRGTVTSQTKARIGKNPILERMYGDAPSAGGGNSGMVTVQIPGSPAGQIPASALQKFKADHPNAQVTQ